MQEKRGRIDNLGGRVGGVGYWQEEWEQKGLTESSLEEGNKSMFNIPGKELMERMEQGPRGERKD